MSKARAERERIEAISVPEDYTVLEDGTIVPIWSKELTLLFAKLQRVETDEAFAHVKKQMYKQAPKCTAKSPALPGLILTLRTSFEANVTMFEVHEDTKANNKMFVRR